MVACLVACVVACFLTCLRICVVACVVACLVACVVACLQTCWLADRPATRLVRTMAFNRHLLLPRPCNRILDLNGPTLITWRLVRYTPSPLLPI